MLLAACEQFLGKAEQEIRRVALETLGEIFSLMKLLLSNGDTHLIFKNNICVVFNWFQRDINVLSWVQWLSR